MKKDGTFRRCRILIYMLLSVFLLSAIILQTGCSWFSSKDLILTVIESNGSEEDRQLQRDCIEEYVQAFENTYEQTVKVQYVKDIPAELSDTDVILVGCDGALEYMAGQTVDLSSYFSENQIVTDDYLNTALSLGDTGFGQCFIPFHYDRAVIYADQEIFDKAGVSLPDGEWTYDEFLETLQQLTYRGGDGTRYTGIYMPYYMPYVWKTFLTGLSGVKTWERTSSGTMALSEAAYEDAVYEWNQIYMKGYARSYGYNVRGSDTAVCAMSLTYACSPDQNGRYVESVADLAANPGTNTEALMAENRLVMLPIPSFSGQSVGVANTDFIHGFMVSKESRKADEAAALALFSLSDEGQRILNQYYGGIPVKKSLWEQDFWKRGLLSGASADTVLIGIEQDMRDDYADLLIGDPEIYDKNIRLRTLFSAFLIRDYGDATKTANGITRYLEDFDAAANQTIQQ